MAEAAMEVDEVTLSEGLEECYNNGGYMFEKAEIDVSTLFDEHGNLEADADGFLGLGCLDVLRNGTGQPLFFMPKKIFVRHEMKEMFPQLLTKSNKFENQKILTGSPGIGKSVLFFLAALRYQLLPENSEFKVSYIRKVVEEGNISLFVMEPGGQENIVKVLFSLSIEKKDYSSLFEMWKEFRRYSNKLQSSSYKEFVDGPKHNEKFDLLNDGFRFLCTSGGYPTPSQSAIMAQDVKILSGWSEEQILDVLRKEGLTDSEASAIYALSGGRIRLAIWGLEKEFGASRIKDWFDNLITDCAQGNVILALTKSDSSASAESLDRLRTRFVNYNGERSSLLIIDSLYAVMQLRGRLDFGDFISAFSLAGVCNLQSARGWFFEELMHLWFKTMENEPVTKWVRSQKVDGAGGGISELNREELYWIPSISNFANIDAAFVYRSKLVCVQYTVRTAHEFNRTTFWQDFASRVRNEVSFKSIAVWFVSPNQTNFQLSHSQYDQLCAANNDSVTLRSDGAVPTIHVSFHKAEVTCDSADALGKTASQLIFLSLDYFSN